MKPLRNTHRVPECGLRNGRTVKPVIALALGLLVGPLAVWAQQAGGTYRLGNLQPITPVPSDAAVLSRRILTALYELASVVGPNLAVEQRCADGRIDRLPELTLAGKGWSVLPEPGPRPAP
ncbi:MAG TPA: hypothetical protein VEH53_02630 [archaeon]|nr:hypothetical protein [archaeon]